MNIENLRMFFYGTKEEVTDALLALSDAAARAFGRRNYCGWPWWDIQVAAKHLKEPITREEVYHALGAMVADRHPVYRACDEIADAWYVHGDMRRMLTWAEAYHEWWEKTIPNRSSKYTIEDRWVLTYTKRSGYRMFRVLVAPRHVHAKSDALWGWTPAAFQSGRPPRCYGRPVTGRRWDIYDIWAANRTTETQLAFP